MPWARLDDLFHVHTKVQDALDARDGLEELGGPAAIGLWVLALSRSYLPTVNRPVVQAREARRLMPRVDPNTVDRLAMILVDAGLWDAHPDGYAIHDWEAYRPPFDSAEAKSLGGKVRAANAPRQHGKFASGRTVDNRQQGPAAPAPAGSAGGPGVTSSAGASTAGPAETSSTRSTRTHTHTRTHGESTGTVGGSGGEDGVAYMRNPAWAPFLSAWHERFRLPPTEAQATILWDAIDAFPGASVRVVQECPLDMGPVEVIGAVLEHYHAIRQDAMVEAARAEVEADARKRAEAAPRRPSPGPVRVATVLDDLPM